MSCFTSFLGSQNATKRLQIRFADVIFGARATRLFAQRRIVPLRHDDDPCVRVRRLDLPGRGEPVHRFQLQIHQDHIGLMFAVRGQGLAAIAALDHVLNQIGDKGLDHSSHGFAVVDDEDLHDSSGRLKAA